MDDLNVENRYISFTLEDFFVTSRIWGRNIQRMECLPSVIGN